MGGIVGVVGVDDEGEGKGGDAAGEGEVGMGSIGGERMDGRGGSETTSSQTSFLSRRQSSNGPILIISDQSDARVMEFTIFLPQETLYDVPPLPFNHRQLSPPHLLLETLVLPEQLSQLPRRLFPPCLARQKGKVVRSSGGGEGLADEGKG